MQAAQQHKSAAPQKLFNSKYLIFSVSLSLFATGVVLYYTYTPDGFEYVRLKRMPGLVIAFVVTLLKIWFTAAKIRYLAYKKISWMGAIRVVIAWDFASAITPSTIGGAPLGIYAMTREHIPLGQASAITLYGLLLDQLFYIMVIPVLIIAGMYYEVVPTSAGSFGKWAMITIYATLLVYGFALAYGVLVNPRAMSKAVRLLFKLPGLRKHADKIEREMDNLVKTSNELRKMPFSFLLKAYFLSSMAWICRGTLPTIVVLSFLPADEVLSFLRSFAMSFASLFMPTPGGSGGVEGLFVLFQGSLMDRDVFIGIATFMWRLFTFYMIIGIGVMVMSWYLNTSKVSSYVADKIQHNNDAETDTADSDDRHPEHRKQE